MDHHSDVLCGRIQITEKFGIKIEVAVIQPVYDFLPDDVREYFHVHHIAGTRVRKTRDLYDQFIVMAMIVGQIALPENGSIRLIIPGWVVQSVGGVEMLLAAYGHWMGHGRCK
jgi:hypothetical protein